VQVKLEQDSRATDETERRIRDKLRRRDVNLNLQLARTAKDETERRIYAKLRRSDIIIPVSPGLWIICAALVAPEEAEQLMARLEEGLREGPMGVRDGLEIRCSSVIPLNRPSDEVAARLWREIDCQSTALRTLSASR
jgi:hypothetical protein